MISINEGLLRMWQLKFRKRLSKKCKKPAIALITSGMENGGLEQVIMDLYHGYKSRGYRAYIVCQHWMINSVKDLIEAPEDIFVFENDLQTLIHFLWRRDIRSIHYHYNTFGMKELKLLGLKILYTMHNTYTWMGDNEIKAYGQLLKNADFVIPVSNVAKEYFCRRSGCSDNNFIVINNGIDFSDLENHNADANFEKRRIGLKDEQLVIGFVGSFYHAKNQVGMIGVAEKIVEKYPFAYFVFMGSKGDDKYYACFLKELKESSARQHIVIMPPVPHNQMGSFYRKTIDILALPSLHEGGPLVAIEAMYCGKPMVLTPVGIAEEIAKNAACLICDAPYEDLSTVTDQEIKTNLSLKKHAKNEASVVNCLSEIIDHYSEFKKMAEQRKKNAMTFSIDAMMDAYIDLLEK